MGNCFSTFMRRFQQQQRILAASVEPRALPRQWEFFVCPKNLRATPTFNAALRFPQLQGLGGSLPQPNLVVDAGAAETSAAAAFSNFLYVCGKSDKFSALSTPIITQQSSGSGNCLELGFTARMQLACNKSWTFPSWPLSLSAERAKPFIFNSVLGFFSLFFIGFSGK